MITIMGQMEKASKIFDYLFLGTEWNACNWEELEANKCALFSVIPFFVNGVSGSRTCKSLVCMRV